MIKWLTSLTDLPKCLESLFSFWQTYLSLYQLWEISEESELSRFFQKAELNMVIFRHAQFDYNNIQHMNNL